MKNHGLWALLVSVCVGLTLLASGEGVEAAPKKKEKATGGGQPAVVEKTPVINPKRIKWQTSPKKLGQLYNKVIERDYLPKYKEAEPGIQMERLTNEVTEAKRTFRQSYVHLHESPSSLDGTAFEGEWVYGNNEGYMKVKRFGRWRYFFFWQKKLYKIIDTWKLGEKSKWGVDYDTAVTKLEDMIGTAGRKLKVDENAGRLHDEVDWASETIHFKLVNWSKTRIAFVWVDKSRVAALAEARVNAKKKKEAELDPDVKDALRGNENEKEKEKKEKKEKKK